MTYSISPWYSETEAIIFYSTYILFQKNATPSLRDINMHVKEGQLVAVVGSVGSGMEFFISGWKIIFLISTTKWLNR